jgi:hypothetical protein
MSRHPNISYKRRILAMSELKGFEDEAVVEGDARHAHDSRMNIRFYPRATRNEPASIEAGRDVFDERDYITIQVPGDAKSSYDAVVTREHQLRWPAQWAAYKAGATQGAGGTTLDKLPGFGVSMVATLAGIGIHTVEQLANLSDGNAGGILGANELRKRAKAYLSMAEGNATKENTDDIASLKEQIAALQALVPKTPEPVVAPALAKTAAKVAETAGA